MQPVGWVTSRVSSPDRIAHERPSCPDKSGSVKVTGKRTSLLLGENSSDHLRGCAVSNRRWFLVQTARTRWSLVQHPGAIDQVALFQVTHDAPQKAVRDLDVLGSDAVGASYSHSDLREEFEKSVTALRRASTQSRRNSGMSRGDDNGVEDIEPSSDHRLKSQHKLSCSWHLRPGSGMPWSSCRNATTPSPKVV